MAGATVDQATQIQASAPSAAMVGSNTRVKGQPGFLGTAQDMLTFSDGATGVWIAPNYCFGFTVEVDGAGLD